MPKTNQMLGDLQQVMGVAQRNTGLSDDVLGTILVILALITELGVIAVLFEEADKIDAAVDYAFGAGAANFGGGNNNNVLEGIAEVNESVADVLKELCCLKEAVIKELKLGIYLRNNAPAAAFDVE